MENLDLIRKLPKEVQRLVDELLTIPTVKIQTPYYKYDYVKITIGLTELSEFITTRCITTIDDSMKTKLVDKILNIIYPIVDDRIYSMQEIGEKIQKVFNI